MSTLIGSLGPDWLRRHGHKQVSDDTLRSWRDFLESELSRSLNLNVDLQIGDRTRFQFLGGSDTHTVIEIESFARKALDVYLARQGR